MEKMKFNKKTIIIIILVLGTTVFAFTSKLSPVFKKQEESTIKQNVITKKIISQNNYLATPQQDIIGTWVNENSSDDKLMFNSNGVMHQLVNNVVTYTYAYEISNTWDGVNYSSDNSIYLKTTDEDGEVAYDWISNLGSNTGDYLTIVNGPSKSGGTTTYIKE